MKVLLTGASGFVGSHVLRHLLVNTDWEIVCPVTFRHKGLPYRLESSVCDRPDWTDRVKIIHWDLRSPADPMTLRSLEDCEVFMNVASESHVDRSIAHPEVFARNNHDLMANVLQTARTVQPRLLLQMSTDEVYGPAYGSYRHKEWDPVIPSNPYAASKADQEAMCIAAWRTYGVPVVITNTMNIVGEMQDPEKFLPMIIRNLRSRRPIPVHVASDGTPGSRYYLHARNLADAWLWLARRALDTGLVQLYAGGYTRPERYHIVGSGPVGNDQLVHIVGRIMGLEREVTEGLIKPVDFHSTRPGHDPVYALDGSRIAALGWTAPVAMDDALERTVKWSLEHPGWLDL